MWPLIIYLTIFTSFRDVSCLRKLQILHTNDMHARYLEVDEDSVTCAGTLAKENRCYGGFARVRQAAIDAKKEATRQNISSIFLNAGDTLTGTPYYSKYKWEITAPLADAMEFDAMSLGNHEFDDGIDNLVQYLTSIRAPKVATNLKHDSRLNETILRKSIVLNVDGLKIGIVGYITLSTVRSSKDPLVLLDEITSLREETKLLKSNGTKLIIALGHSGLKRDMKVASEVEDIDVIVAGHSHSLLYTPKDHPPRNEPVDEIYPYPVWVTQKSNKKVPIVHAFAFTKYLGRLTVTLDDNGSVIAAEGNPILLDHTHLKNAELENKVQSLTANLTAELDEVVGTTKTYLKVSNWTSSRIESTFLNLITDAFIERSVFIAQEQKLNQWTRHAVAFFLNTGVRADLDSSRNGGNITKGDLLTTLPFQTTIYECTMTGSSIKKALEITAEEVDPKKIYFNNVLHFSGLRVVYDLRKEPKNRIHSIQIICTECSVPYYEDLDENKSYLVIADSYILSSRTEYSYMMVACTNQKLFDTQHTSDIVEEYIRRHQIIYPKLDGRIQVLGYGET